MSNTDYAVATGEYIEEWLEGHDMTPAELARATGVSRKHISCVIGGAPVTPDFAHRLELVTSVPATRWLALESQYRIDLKRLALAADLEADPNLYETFKNSLKALRDAEIIDGGRQRKGLQLVQLMAFFEVGSPASLDPAALLPQASFMKSQTLDASQASLATWLRLARRRARKELLQNTFDPAALEGRLSEIRSLSRSFTQHPQRLGNTLADCGVRLVLLPEVKGCRAYGATMWDNHGPIIVLSGRGKNDGILWFSLFHELGHVLLHPHNTFVDFDDDPGADAQREIAANAFAEEHLIPPSIQAEVAALRTDTAARVLAKREAISPGIIVRHLQHRNIWPRNRGHGLVRKIDIGKLAV